MTRNSKRSVQLAAFTRGDQPPLETRVGYIPNHSQLVQQVPPVWPEPASASAVRCPPTRPGGLSWINQHPDGNPNPRYDNGWPIN